MKKILKSTLVDMFALLMTFTTSSKAFAHLPIGPDNSSMFTVIQLNSIDGWTRNIFLGDAVNDLNWEMTRSGTLYINTIFENIEDYRIAVYSPVNGQIFFGQMYTGTDSPSAHVYNLNPGQYRILVYNYTTTYFY